MYSSIASIPTVDGVQVVNQLRSRLSLSWRNGIFYGRYLVDNLRHEHVLYLDFISDHLSTSNSDLNPSSASNLLDISPLYLLPPLSGHFDLRLAPFPRA